MMTFQYQNPVTGDAHVLDTLISAARWSTARAGKPASLELSMLHHDDIALEHGGIVTAIDDRLGGIFYGYLFKQSRNEKSVVTLTAYDQTRYLKNKDTYVFAGVRADEITRQIAEDFELKVGELANTGYAIPGLIEDNKGLFDIILKALDLTLINSGSMFYLWDDFGSLRISNVADSRLDLVVGDNSLATGYTYSSDIDSETYNKIKLMQDNQASGKRDVYLFQDSGNMRLWGILQNTEIVNEAMNEAQIKARGGQMLELYNRPRRQFEISALSDLSVRAGRGLMIRLEELGINQFFIVEEAAHDLMKETMSLKLKVI